MEVKEVFYISIYKNSSLNSGENVGFKKVSTYSDCYTSYGDAFKSMSEMYCHINHKNDVAFGIEKLFIKN